MANRLLGEIELRGASPRNRSPETPRHTKATLESVGFMERIRQSLPAGNDPGDSERRSPHRVRYTTASITARLLLQRNSSILIADWRVEPCTDFAVFFLNQNIHLITFRAFPWIKLLVSVISNQGLQP